MHHRPGFLIIILTCLFTVGLPSCGEDYVAYRNIHDVAIYDQETNQVWLTPYSTSSDSIALIVSMELSYFTDNNIHPVMMNEAWATSPSEPILANEIIDVRLFCDKPVYSIPAGTNIISEMLLGYYPEGKYSYPDFLEALPSKGSSWAINDIYIFFREIPAPGVYTFTVEIEDNNGHIFIVSAPVLEWQ